MAGILTITLNPALDLHTDIDHVAPERKLRCGPPLRHPGGGGINVSRALANLGGDSLALWPGGGHTGAMLRELMDEAGIDHHFLEIEGETRENLIVLETDSGQQYRFGMPGATLTNDALERLLAFVAETTADYVVASGSLPPGVPDDFYARIGRSLPAAVHYLVDTSGEALRQCLSSDLSLLKPNLRELGLLVGRELESDQAAEEAARSLIDQHALEAVLVSLGAGGALLVTPSESLSIRSPTVKIASKVGAGDSMVAGLVLMLAQGADLPTAARYAVASGAAAVTTPATELCDKATADELYTRILKQG